MPTSLVDQRLSVEHRDPYRKGRYGSGTPGPVATFLGIASQDRAPARQAGVLAPSRALPETVSGIMYNVPKRHTASKCFIINRQLVRVTKDIACPRLSSAASVNIGAEMSNMRRPSVDRCVRVPVKFLGQQAISSNFVCI